jgi:acyl-coenzyme A synthetase/AMP-(fatty) acid ligase
LFVGGSLILNNHSITESNFWEKFRNCSPTHLGGVPFSYEIYKRFEGEIFSNHSVDTLTQAGGRLSEKLVYFFAEKCLAESKNFYVMYGQTEATARISFLPAKRAIDKPGSIGRAIPGGQIFLLDSTNELINVPHTAGELVYAGPNVSLGYAKSLKDLFSNEERQELLHTGDIGFFDADGDFFITGRSSRYAKINSVRINLEEIDSFLAELGFISATTSNDIKIFVFLENRHPFDELKVKIQQLANIRPSQVEISQIDFLPRTNSGKINFKELDNWI